jgi:hypothetical protein
MVQVGNELQTVENRLKDIVFIAMRGEPVEGGDQEAVIKMMGEIARDALTYLRVTRGGK